ncbi:MAG: DUF3015 domain-containing protein [Nitrospirota bacterium]|nr:DUF3015 domain-containing protein [Nitrospirota bacterium]MDH5773643.1 DUF3015 domain-containing protein [Nitrospirota bacterium]
MHDIFKPTAPMLTAIVLIFLTIGVALGAHPDNGPGCGLGKLAWSDYPNQQTIWAQVLQSTTNGTFGAQTFGISSGTSGCTNNGTLFASEKVNVFAAVNFDNLAQEMAQGQGEHLTSLATLMGIPAEQHGVFFAMAQEKYMMLIQAGENPSQALIQALYQLLI